MKSAVAKRPIGIIILAILLIIVALMVASIGSFMWIFLLAMSSGEGQMLLFGIGAITVAIAITLIIAAVGALLLKKWGWVLSLLCCISIALYSASISLTGDIPYIMICAAAVGSIVYLFTPGVMRAFGWTRVLPTKDG